MFQFRLLGNCSHGTMKNCTEYKEDLLLSTIKHSSCSKMCCVNLDLVCFCYHKNWIYFFYFCFNDWTNNLGFMNGKKNYLFVNVEWLCRSCIKSVKNLINLLGSLSINWRKLQKHEHNTILFQFFLLFIISCKEREFSYLNL